MGQTTNLNWLAGFLNHQQYVDMEHHEASIRKLMVPEVEWWVPMQVGLED